ncbi:MAG: type II/IV secretion system protein [Thermoflavifilum sp.]|nr:type II/IV secretion system protein [Thermoflavifilum sp.]MCL6514500.1 GspE/PulE family protein [Alicyclobacillus sp.]
MARKRLGDFLLDAGLITAQQLQEAMETQRETRQRLGEVLVQKGYVTEQQLIEVLEFQLGIPHVNLFQYQIDPSIVRLIPEDLARRYLVLALRRDKAKLMVAMADPLDFYAIDDLKMSTGFQIEPVIASKEELRIYIERYYGIQESVEELSMQVEQEEELESQVTDEDSPVVRLVNQIILQALQQRASDIHFDPGPSELLVRFRVDGLLRTEQRLPRSMLGVIVARIKIMANLNIAERRLPQDGRMQYQAEFRTVDIRVSTLPTVHGEKCVLRLLDPQNAVVDIERLGFTEANLALFREMLHGAHGIVLITGPTGSGKTSTLYAALSTMATEERNIITVEDPVEYQLAGVNQVQVNEVTGLTFARGLRSILRQDPDVIMVGEIRDYETAEIAVRAALTGHFVLSTLHTNDAVSSLTRLTDMGVEPYLVASAVRGVVAQRLVRRVCPECSEAYEPSAVERYLLESRGLSAEHLVKGRGCAYCARTGYRGRMAIHELVRLDDEIRRMVLDKRPDSEYRSHLAELGMKTMLDDGLMKAAAGMTTLDEVLRVTIREA